MRIAPKSIWIRVYAATLALCCAATHAEVVEIKVEQREPVLAGAKFGEAGAYEKLSGTVVFAVDPEQAVNRVIVDLDKAPRDKNGKVTFSANFMVLQPVGDAKDGVGVVEVSNRGGKALLPYFQSGTFSGDPRTKEEFGDGLLMRRGYTLAWIGWQADVPAKGVALRLNAPVARDGDNAIEGLVRADWVIERPQTTLPLAHRDHIAYGAIDLESDKHVLTERDGRDSERREVPRDEWRFARETNSGVVEDPTFIYKASGFKAGKVYELVYRAKDPKVVGLGLAAVRDFAAFAKYDEKSPFRFKHAVAFGVSQTGRFLRHFLYQGFNTDEQDRQVFDGMFIHSAGAGRGSFNHRFAQPSRDAHRFSSFYYPTDLFPFSGREQKDSESDAVAGIMPTKHAPKIFYTNTGYEYWGRAASLLHTTPDGKADIDLLANERLYHLASGMHFVTEFPPQSKLPGTESYFGNPLDYLINLRALLPRLVNWVARGKAPPQSAYPRIADKTLVPVDALRFPSGASVAAPKVLQQPRAVNYGQRWREGIIDLEPPSAGKAYGALVPQVDEFGNELGGIRNVELQAPLATYRPWCLRIGKAGPQDELMDFFGTFTPLPAAKRNVEDNAAYFARAREAALRLRTQGYLLEEDMPRVLRRASQIWDFVH